LTWALSGALDVDESVWALVIIILVICCCISNSASSLYSHMQYFSKHELSYVNWCYYCTFTVFSFPLIKEADPLEDVITFNMTATSKEQVKHCY